MTLKVMTIEACNKVTLTKYHRQKQLGHHFDLHGTDIARTHLRTREPALIGSYARQTWAAVKGRAVSLRQHRLRRTPIVGKRAECRVQYEYISKIGYTIDGSGAFDDVGAGPLQRRCCRVYTTARCCRNGRRLAADQVASPGGVGQNAVAEGELC